MPTVPYRAVFFDAGGTLIHMDRAFLLECLAANGVACDEARLAAAEHEARERMRARARSARPGTDAERFREAWAGALGGLGCTADAARAVTAAARERSRAGLLWTRVEPGTQEALESLRSRGLVLGVVSNADGRVAEYLRSAGLLGLLDFVVDSALVGVEKPDPRIFRIACERSGVEPARAVHVGDLYEIDVLGARAAGLDAFLIGSANGGAVECESLPTVAALPERLLGTDARAHLRS